MVKWVLRWFGLTVCDNCRVVFWYRLPYYPSRCPRCNDDEIVKDDVRRANIT